MKHFLSFCIFFVCNTLLAQHILFLQPADTLQKKRLYPIIGASAVIASTTYYSLSAAWYKDYPQADFHFKNDNTQWLQMDKAGHIFASYQFSVLGNDLLRWSGVKKQHAALYGALAGWASVSAIELFDGYSAQWGASWGDLAANTGGAILFAGQELLWQEQRIITKFSFHTTPYASARPSVLGNNLGEQVIKDYNGQTYWLSANVNAFLPNLRAPKWLNIAIGYGAEGMITGEDELINPVFFPEKVRVRQFYLSLDVDLRRIKTKSQWLKTCFAIFNTIKIPAPTIELRSDGIFKLRPMYF